MSKELEQLQKIASFKVDKIYDVKFENGDSKHYEYETIRDLFPNEFAEIETALKRLNTYENYGINLKPEDDVDKLIDLNGKLTYIDKVLDTQQRLIMSVSSEEINILSKVFNSQVKKVRKQLKALEIIKEKRVNVQALFYSTNCEDYNKHYTHYEDLTQEEYDLLKKVLL